MAHFAELDENNVVKRVLVVNDDYLIDENGNEVEALGRAHMQSFHGGRWVQTSYNGNIRGHFAGIGWIYREDLDLFVAPKPYPSWKLNQTTLDWDPPVPKPSNKPNNGQYVWDEEAQNWIVEEFPPKNITTERFRSQLTLTEKLLWDNPDTASTLSQKAIITTFKAELPLLEGTQETTELLDLLVSEGVFAQQRLNEIISNI